MRFDFELADPSHLDSVLRTIKKIDASTTPIASCPAAAKNRRACRATAREGPTAARLASPFVPDFRAPARTTCSAGIGAVGGAAGHVRRWPGGSGTG